MRQLGTFIRQKREELLKTDRTFSQLQISKRLGIEQSYLSKVERGVATQLSEEKIVHLAEILGEDPDYMLALGGKVSGDVLAIITQRPRLFARLVRDMKHMSEDVIEADHDFKRRQSRMNRIYDFAALGFFHLEKQADRSMWSSHTPAILGLPDDTPPSLDAVTRSLAPVDRNRFIELEQEACRQLEPYSCELRIDAEDAQPRFIRIWGDFEFCEASEAVVQIGLIQDVTREVASREELRQAQQALSGTVKQQSRQLSQGIEELKREIAARKKLEGRLLALNEEIARQRDVQREYMQQSAYELRSLVNRLVVGKEDLHGDTLSSTLSLISTAIDNMNDFFEMPTGLSPLAEAFSPKNLAEGWAADLSRAQLNPGIGLALTSSPNLPERIVGDPQRLQQVAISVIGFLLKATTWGVVNLTLDYMVPDGLLSLTASSPSISETISKESFYPNSTEGLGKGAWMLTTAGPMVEAMGGTVEVSRLSGGVAVSIMVPARPEDEPAREAIDARLPILVVEDDAPSRFFTESVILGEGYRVEAIALGKEALSRLEEQQFSMVFLDIQLPDVDGVTIARTARMDGGLNARTPIIAVTAHGTQEHRQRYEEAGIDQVITKPFKVATLKEMIENYLGG
ncbi:response regulator [uncultured Pseudodesulfovibrio sp.]|uniref:response regulator n=1 Tax=uncultured Pseudodesulfovibrio sp. TaxID=2035858 RepID=UPI0029C654D5|nr:response regulator [uncultured Pseudodesulfovibrio sp.]